MSFGDFEYQETTSNQLARILKGMRQEQIILDAVQNPIDDVEEYPDARQVESVKGTKDHIGATTIPINKNWHYANEPNQDTRVWLWFREGWRLRDYSRHGNEAFAEQVEPAPVPVRNYVPLRRKQNDDGTTSGRLYGIIDGVSQYYRVLDGPENRLTDLLSTNNEFCFSAFFSPFESYTFDEADDRLRFIQKLDDDQSNNATRVELEEDGTVHFYLVYKGTAYHVETAPGVVPLVQVPEFQPGEFIDEEFMTQSPYAWQWNPNVAAPDWIWLFFSFDKTTRQLKIFKVQQAGIAATELVTTTAAPNDQTILANVSMWLPANEDDPDAIATYDITGNENHALFDTDPAHAPTYLTDGFLHFHTDDCNANVENVPELNTLSTAFTVAFKVRLHSFKHRPTIDAIFSKSYQQPGGLTGGFIFYITGTTTANVILEMYPSTGGGGFQFLGIGDAITTLNTWHNVIWTYDGTTHTLRVDGLTSSVASSGNIFTTSNDYTLGDVLDCFRGDLADVVVVKGEAWNSTKRAQYNSRTAGFRTPDWPAYKAPPPPEPETPLPVVRPVEMVYQLVLPDTVTVKQLNNPAAATPFVSIFNVPGGTPSTTPEVLKYDCPDGTSGGGSTSPVTTIYNLAAASSTGTIVDSNDEIGYVQRIKVTGSVFIGKNPTDMQFWVGSNGASGGTVYCALFRNDGTYIKFGAGINVNSLTSSWTSISGQSFVTRTNMIMGDGVGIVWEGGTSGTINVRRGGTDTHYDVDGSGNPRSYQDHLETGAVYGSDNDQYSIAGVVKDGGITTTGANPYAKLTLSQYVLGISQTNSTCEGILPSRVIFRVRRVGSAASATLKCYIINSAGTVLKTIGSAISFNSISTTVQDLEFIDRDNAVAWADTYMVALAFDVKTGINNTTVYLEVNYNIGPSGAGQVEGTAIKARMYNGTSAYVDVSPVCDWAGKIYIGGSSFTSYKQFTPQNWAMAEKVNSGATPAPKGKLFAEKFSKLKVTMKKVGSPTGPIQATVWDNGGTQQVIFPNAIDASSLTTSDADYIYTFPTNAYNSVLNDRIGLQYMNATATDYVLVKINTDAAAGAAGDGAKSVLSIWNAGVGWADDATLDFAFEVFTGGVPDLTSRSKAAIRCDSIFSILNRKKVTRAVIPLKKIGAPTGNYFIRSVRGSDSSNRDLLGSGDISLLSTSAWTYKDVSNYNATFFVGESDKIVVEYEGGDSANGLLIQVQQDSTYDDADTRYEDFDSVNWNTAGYDTYDMGATLYVGGDTYIPDAGTPYVPPPDFYDHDWLIGTGAYVKGLHTSFYGMRIRDFKVETSIPTLENIDTLFDNKYSRRGGKGEVALAGYCTYNTETEPPA